MEKQSRIQTVQQDRLLIDTISAQLPLLYDRASRDSSVGIATGCMDEGSEVESRYCQEFSLLQIVQTGSEVHSTSYPKGTAGSFPWGKAAGA
jgi:hypothetical protein